MSEGYHHYAFDLVFAFMESFHGRSIGFEANFDLTEMIVQYIGIVIKVLEAHREVR